MIFWRGENENNANLPQNHILKKMFYLIEFIKDRLWTYIYRIAKASFFNNSFPCRRFGFMRRGVLNLPWGGTKKNGKQKTCKMPYVWAQGGDWTHDLPLRRRMPYPLGHMSVGYMLPLSAGRIHLATWAWVTYCLYRRAVSTWPHEPLLI